MQVVKRMRFMSYYGGKGSLSWRYPPPRYDTIIEPFAGAANYSVRYWDRKVFLYDINPTLIAVWQYLISTPAIEIANLPIHFKDVRELKVCQEAKWLIGWWLGKGDPNPRNMASPWASEGPDSMWGSIVRQKLAKQVEYIRHWKAEVKSYHDIPNQEATWFIDPPYQEGGYVYSHNEIDYKHLAGWSRGRQGQVMVCEAGQANWLPFRLLKVSTGVKAETSSAVKRRYKELIWTN